MKLIPLARIPGQSLNIVLAGQNCTIDLYWRQARLYLDLSVDGRSVCQGAICQNGSGVLSSPSRHFNGNLHFIDLEGDNPPHWEGLYSGGSDHTGSPGNAGRYLLVYLENESDKSGLGAGGYAAGAGV